MAPVEDDNVRLSKDQGGMNLWVSGIAESVQGLWSDGVMEYWEDQRTPTLPHSSPPFLPVPNGMQPEPARRFGQEEGYALSWP